MEDKDINIVDYWNIIWKKRKFIIITVLIIAIISAGISLLLPKWYKATTVIMPFANEEGNLSGLTASLGAFGLSGVLGGSENQMHMLAILKSRRMLEELLKKFNFQERYDTKYKFQTLNILRSNFFIEIGEEEQIIISFLDQDQNLVADIVNYITYCLDSLNIELSTSKAKSNREFIEYRLNMMQDSLFLFENEVLHLMKHNNIISLDEQLSAEIEQLSDIEAQIMAKEIGLCVMKERLNPNSQAIKDSEIEFRILKNKYSELLNNPSSNRLFINLDNVPEIQKQYAQLQRKLFYFSTLLEYLGPQYEQAKIEEAKDVPTIQIIDKAERPEWKSKPKRAYIVLTSIIVTFFIISITLVVKENRSKK